MTKDIPKPPSPQKAYRTMMHQKILHIRKLARAHVHESMHIEDNDLDEYQIKMGDNISLDPDVIDFGPRFCEPFPADRLQELWKTRWNYEDPSIEFPKPCVLGTGGAIAYYFMRVFGDPICDNNFAASTPWDTTSWTTRRLTILCQAHTDDSLPGWVMKMIHRLRDGSSTHTACTLYDYSNIPPDDRLHTAEILCAASLMRQALKLDKKRQFKVAPVFVYSISYRYARFLQAHFDGDSFVVRKSEWLDFDQDIPEKVDLFLRWMMCTPIGSTRFSPLPNESVTECVGRQDSGNNIALQCKEAPETGV